MADEQLLSNALRHYYARISSNLPLGAEFKIRNFRKAVIRFKINSYYKDQCRIRINPDGTVKVDLPEYAPTKEEAKDIKADKREMPQTIIVPLVNARAFIRSKGWRENQDVYVFPVYRSTEVIMLEQRFVANNGDKVFLTWCCWDDGEWRQMEPDGRLPLWKPLQHGNKVRIMVHEGAKEAETANRIAPAHPWYKELSQYEHWGFCGGAYAAPRTDWQEVRKASPIAVVFACDNDEAGIKATKAVSKHYGGALLNIRYDGHGFPLAWDLADEMPEKMFENGKYDGPSFDELLGAATWATKVVGEYRKKPVYGLKDEFVREWVYVIKPEVYIHRRKPTKLLIERQFNKAVRSLLRYRGSL